MLFLGVILQGITPVNNIDNLNELYELLHYIMLQGRVTNDIILRVFNFHLLLYMLYWLSHPRSPGDLLFWTSTCLPLPSWKKTLLNFLGKSIGAIP